MKNVGSVHEPKLAKPGAGLPFFEWAVANYIFLPRLFKNTNKEKAIAFFVAEAHKIVDIVSDLNLEKLSQRRLINRLAGLEDSSRYWSVAMTLDHLIIVSDSVRKLILELSTGGSNFKRVGTADVKPNIDVDPAIILDLFKEMNEHFVEDLNATNINAFPKATHPHPWFGEQNSQNWLAIAGSHMRIHRQQIEAIIVQL